jgi:hypothetical protein
MTRPSEDDLIARFFTPLATAAGADGLTDDAAVIPEGEGDLVVTKDMAIAGVHFFPDDPPDLIAAKALRVNLSDLAAKGAVPAGFLLGLGLPPDWTTDFLATFAGGLARDIEAYACPLYGGDTVKVPGAADPLDHGLRPGEAHRAPSRRPARRSPVRHRHHRRRRARRHRPRRGARSGGRPRPGLALSPPNIAAISWTAISPPGRARPWRRRSAAGPAPPWTFRMALRVILRR